MPTGMAAAGNLTEVPTTREIISQPAAWASFTGHFCGNYFWYFLLTWLPFYLVRERHFTLEQMASIGSLAYMVTAVSSIVAGWISDRAMPTAPRPHACAGCAPAADWRAPPWSLASRSFRTGRVHGPADGGVRRVRQFSSSHWAITQTLAGPLAAGKWSGVQNFVANLSGVVAPAITGIVVDRTGQFLWAFAASALVVLIGAGAYVFGLAKVEPVTWKTRKGAD